MHTKRTLSQPPDWWQAFQQAADRRRLTLSEWLGIAAQAQLTKQERQELSPRIPRGRPSHRRDDDDDRDQV